MRALAAALILVLQFAACTDDVATRTPERALEADSRTVRNIVASAQSRDYTTLGGLITPDTTLRIDGRVVAEPRAQAFAGALEGCRLLHTYGFGGNGINPSRWHGETIIITDWNCPVPSEPDGDTTWTFEFDDGALVRVHNDPFDL